MSFKEHPPQLDVSKSRQLHVPVLLDATLDILKPKLGDSYLDLTAGYGGHASAFFERTKNYSGSVLVDRDDYAIRHLKSLASKGAGLMHADFVSAASSLISDKKQFDIVVVDLGVSSPQLDQSERGFSFTNSGPLDMRMDRRQDISAHDLVNTLSSDELTHIISQYGEESHGHAVRIAQAIVKGRPLENTKQLADLIAHQYRGKWKRIHPATRTFQAIRIAVNKELHQIEKLMPMIPKLLKSGGRVGVISFHSLEDRIVKRHFKNEFDAGLESSLAPLSKKPIDGATYDVHNPRSRSAKLRAAVKK